MVVVVVYCVLVIGTCMTVYIMMWLYSVFAVGVQGGHCRCVEVSSAVVRRRKCNGSSVVEVHGGHDAKLCVASVYSGATIGIDGVVSLFCF